MDRKEVVTFEELLVSNTIQQEAMLNVLERKGLINKQEVLEEMKKIRKEQ